MGSTFNFNNSTVSGSNIGVNVTVQNGSLTKQDLHNLLEHMRSRGLGEQTYNDLYKAAQSVEVIGNNVQTRNVVERLSNAFKIGGEAIRTIPGALELMKILHQFM